MENISLTWAGDLELLKQLVKETVNLDGVWTSWEVIPRSLPMVIRNKYLLPFTGEKSDEEKQEVCKQLLYE